jgi:hypothetical protein
MDVSGTTDSRRGITTVMVLCFNGLISAQAPANTEVLKHPGKNRDEGL